MAAPHVSGSRGSAFWRPIPHLPRPSSGARLLTYAVPAGPANQYGAGIVNARNSLLQTMGPTRQIFVRLLDATTLDPVATNGCHGGAYSFTGCGRRDLPGLRRRG